MIPCTSVLGLLNWASLVLLIEATVTHEIEDFATGPVFVYDVDLPLPNYGIPCASQIVVNQIFSNSYGHPALIQYSPPAECADFTHVTAQITLSSYDYQYDRLIHLIKDGIEVWRPSTPEPVGRNITSKETKDLSTFVNLFNTEGLLEFSLANIISSANDGPYDAELQLFYYRDTQGHLDDNSWFYDPNSPPTKLQAVVANVSTIYQQPAVGVISSLPRNVTRAVLNVFASGNSNEEFWYANDLSQGGPTRLVQVFIDGTLAGVADPFPIVYTGGLNPELWQPLMGLKAADVPSYVIDITPFLPSIWNKSVDVTIAVGTGYGQPESILSNWLISASLLTWESEGLTGVGTIQQTNSTGTGAPINGYSNSSFEEEGAQYTHEVFNSAALQFSDQKNKTYAGVFSWYQYAQMVNHLNETSLEEFVKQVSHGLSKSTWKPSNGSAPIEYERSHYYPLDLAQVVTESGYNQLVSFNRSFEVNVTNLGVEFWETIVQASTDYESQYTSINDVYAEGYHRHAEAINGEVIVDVTS